MNYGKVHNLMPLTFFVYLKQGLPLNVFPQTKASKLLTIPYGSKVISTGREYFDADNQVWLQVAFDNYKGFIRASFITPFPLPTSIETIKEYYNRLLKMEFDVKYERWELKDRVEDKILLPTANLYEVYLIAKELYPMYSFQIPKCQYKQEKLLVHETPEEDLIEEMVIFRDSDGELIRLEYIADFGNSSDIINIIPHVDYTLLSFGTYKIEQVEDEKLLVI